LLAGSGVDTRLTASAATMTPSRLVQASRR
jgi:hypothetical protein